MKPACQVVWFVETQGVTLYSRDGTVRCSIPYPHAGLWSLIANGDYSEESAAELISVLMSVGRHEAEREVRETLAAWMQARLLSAE